MAGKPLWRLGELSWALERIWGELGGEGNQIIKASGQQ